ncbi:DinB family protein [Brevibacterium sp.]|uniref:DinB family protein n=1 Tax=Brevibacterium sp. TaxID=1701 RepID=UPI0025BE6286|nr:DinB family protein [Brevibacterium sp.]
MPERDDVLGAAGGPGQAAENGDGGRPAGGWAAQLVDQLDWHWRNQLRARLEGLTDEELFWEPVPDCWTVRPRGTGTAPLQGGSGAMTIDFAFPEPQPAPFTTIAWRLGHVLVGVLGARTAAHFGGEPRDYFTYEYAENAAQALAQLDAEYAAWIAGVSALTEEDLAQPCGEAEGQFGHLPMSALVLHINREFIHHLAEICLLRDLYVHSHAVDAHAGERP